MEQEQTNKTIILDFYRRAVAQGDIAWAATIIADDYIQHSTYVKPGKKGLLESLELMKQMPKPVSTTKPFMRLIAEGDFVVTNMSFDWGGKQKAVVDVFRLKDGKVTEHWDAMQDQPNHSLNGRALLDGPLPVADSTLTDNNKAIVHNVDQRVFIQRSVDEAAAWIAQELIQHSPDIADGLAGLQAYLQQPTDQLAIKTVHRLVAEGDFVVVQAEGKQENQSIALFDVFRLSKGRIVEQWRVKQPMP